MQKCKPTVANYILGVPENGVFEFPDPVNIADLYKSPPERDNILIHDFMPFEGGVTLLHGDGGSGKSYVAQELAVALATGTPFLGRFPVEDERARHVAWLDLDQGEKTVQKRLRRRIGCSDLAPEKEPDDDPYDGTVTMDYWRGPEALRLLEENLHMFVFDGAPFSIMSGGPVNEREVQYLNALGNMLVQYDVEVLVIDALVRVLGGASENDSATADEFFRRMRAFQRHVREHSGKPLTIIAIHHDRKPGAEPEMTQQKKYRARGTSAWRDAVELQLGAELQEKAGVVALTVNKDRHTDDAPGGAHYAKFESRLDSQGNLIGKRLVYHGMKENPALESAILNLVTESGDIGINPGMIYEKLSGTGNYIKRMALNSVMYDLMKAGKVVSNVPVGSGSRRKRYYLPGTTLPSPS